MSNLPEIKRRLSSVKQTSQITGAMKTVSAAKMRSARLVYENSARYLSRLVSAARGAVASALPVPERGDDIMIVVSSDRGLCGAFDNEVIRLALRNIDERTAIMPIGLIAAGKTGGKQRTDMRFCSYGKPDYAHAEEIADALLDSYGNGVKRVRIAHARLTGSGAPVIEQILPIVCDMASGGVEVETEREAVAALVPMYVAGMLHAALAESYAAEQRARYAAMSAATESANDMMERLSLEYNRARQASITEQLTEIAGAGAALKERVYNEKRD